MAGKRTAVDALLFDLGGVIINIDFGRAIAAWAKDAKVPAHALAERFTFDAAFDAHERGVVDSAQYFDMLRGSLGVALTDQQLLAGWNAIFVGPAPGIGDLLRRLARALPLYVFSNTNATHRAHWAFRYRELLTPFSAVYCSCDLGIRKPAPEAFLGISERIGVTPDRIAFFDDTPENVHGARAAGLIAFHVSTVEQIRRALNEDLRLGVTSDE